LNRLLHLGTAASDGQYCRY